MCIPEYTSLQNTSQVVSVNNYMYDSEVIKMKAIYVQH